MSSEYIKIINLIIIYFKKVSCLCPISKLMCYNKVRCDNCNYRNNPNIKDLSRSFFYALMEVMHLREVLLIEDEKIIEHRELKDNEDININKKKKDLTPKQLRIVSNKKEIKKHCGQLGGFVHMLCIRNKLLFQDVGIDRANISRIIFLATYLDYNNRQQGLLIKHGKNNKVEALKRKDLIKLLNLKEDTFKSFLKDVTSHNLMYIADDKYYINPSYFNKGENEFDNKEYTRLFINSIRYIYNNCPARQHKNLSYVYQLIPFMNYELNIVCSNPLEVDFYKLNKLSLKDICKLLAVDTSSKRNMYKLRDKLLQFYVVIDGQRFYLFSYVRVLNGYGLKDYFAINPYVVWAGNDMEELRKTLQILFFK